MKVKSEIVTIITLLLLPLVNLHAVDGSKSASDVAWPPPHMRDLPADYLDRLRHALQFESDKFGNPQFKEADVIKVRVGIAALAVGQHVDEVNACFAADGFGWKPGKEFGFTLFSASYVRLYALFNDRTGLMKGRLSPQAQENLERSFWQCAKVYSKLEKAKNDVWVQKGSENHCVTSIASNFLVAQLLKDIPAYAALKYDDGSTLKEQYEALLDYWSKWLDQRARKGLFEEDGSSYDNYTLEALFNLRDFAEDPILRRKADLFLDLAFANTAEECLGTVRGGPKHRTKSANFSPAFYPFLFGVGDGGCGYLLFTTGFYPSPVSVSLARDASSRGVYSWSKRCPHFSVLPPENDPKKDRVLAPDVSIIRNGFATPSFHLGSHGFDATAKVVWQARQQLWQGVVFANHPLARIGMDGKSEHAKGNYISFPFKTIQDRNVMVTMKWGPVTDPGVDKKLWIDFSSALDRVEEEQGWIFVKSGNAFAGVKVVDGYEWVKPWKHSDAINPKSFVRMLQEKSPVIMVVNDAADYGNDFSAFKKALTAEPVSWKDGVCQFATITHEGPFKAGKINGKPVDLAPPLVNDSPFIRSAWDSGVVHIRKGNETLKLDFRDPKNPLRIVGGPVTPEFPSGVGNTKPIVFIKAAADEKASRPNIVVILADDLGYADLGCQGSQDVKTPNIDSLAANGVRCTAGYVTAPQCSPSRAGLLSGCYQQRFGHEGNPNFPLMLMSGSKTIADHLKAAGYATAHYGKWHVGFEDKALAPKAMGEKGDWMAPTQHGFDESFNYADYAKVAKKGSDIPPSLHARDDRVFGRKAAEFIKEHRTGPFFIYLAFHAPHFQQVDFGGYKERFQSPAPGRLGVLSVMAQQDDAVGLVQKSLRENGLETNTLVFFISDNGGTRTLDTPSSSKHFNGSLNTPFSGKKGSALEGGIREPFIVQWKGYLPAGKTYDRPVSTLDVLPTAVAAAQAKPLDGVQLDGVNILPFLLGENAADPHEVLFWRWRAEQAIRMGDWKLVRGKEQKQWRLIDLSKDVKEQNDLTSEQPEIAKRLLARFGQWESKLPPVGPSFKDTTEGDEAEPENIKEGK